MSYPAVLSRQPPWRVILGIVLALGAYTLAGLTASIADLRAVRNLGWSDALLDVAGFALSALAAVLLARRLRPRVTTPTGTHAGTGAAP